VIVGVPAETPVTTPTPRPTVARAVLLLLHVLPKGEEVNVVLDPTHTAVVPLGVDGVVVTLTTVVVIHPVGNVYVITGLPVATPLTIPVDPTLARLVLLLLHVPPVVASLNAVVDPAHTTRVPVIPAGKGLTVTGVVMKQPVDNVYVIVGVPAAAPVKIPVELTVAKLVLLLVQVPPVVGSPNVVVFPTHTFVVPVIDNGRALTVNEVVIPQPVDNV